MNIRPINPADENEIKLVAERMRATLVEVLGEKKGGEMYTMEWLIDRVKFHLDRESCDGEVFVAEYNEEIVGHTIVRYELDHRERPFGLFSTIYVIPQARKTQVAMALIAEGEKWFAARDLTCFRTHTDEHNGPLIRLFQRAGYTAKAVRDSFAILEKLVQE